MSDLYEDIITREELVMTLKEVTDLERLIGRVVYGSAGGRDLVALANGLGKLPRIRELLEGCSSALLQSLRGELDDLPEVRELLQRALVDEPPFSVREGKFIREGYSPEVDRLWNVISGRVTAPRWTGSGTSSTTGPSWWPIWRPAPRSRRASRI